MTLVVERRGRSQNGGEPSLAAVPSGPPGDPLIEFDRSPDVEILLKEPVEVSTPGAAIDDIGRLRAALRVVAAVLVEPQTAYRCDRAACQTPTRLAEEVHADIGVAPALAVA